MATLSGTAPYQGVGAERSGEPRAASATTLWERVLLFSLAALLPLDDHLPVIGGLSTLFLFFVFLAGYVAIFRSSALWRVCWHPIFLATYVFLGLGFAIESLHPNPNYSVLFRVGQMVAGGLFIAALCRDRAAMKAAMIGAVAASVWLSFVLLQTSYGSLSAASATNYRAASQVRASVIGEVPITADLNTMAFCAAQGAALALAFGLTWQGLWRRALFFTISLGCLIGTFLPMSRSGVLTAFVCCVLALLGAKALRPPTVLVGLLAGLAVLALVPDVVFMRMTVDSADGRARVYSAAVEHLPEYAVTGVGVGNYWGRWGQMHGFGEGEGQEVAGSHNGFFQILLYWGFLGLLGLFGVIWQCWRHLPSISDVFPDNALSIGVRILATSLILRLMFIHTIYDKQFSVGLGLLVGLTVWVGSRSGRSPAWRVTRRFVPKPVNG